MRLALKLALIFMLANCALACIYGYLAVRREVRLFQKEAAEEAEEIGPVLEKLLCDAYRNQGDRDVQEMLIKIIDTKQRPVGIHWVWFDKVELEFGSCTPYRAADGDHR